MTVTLEGGEWSAACSGRTLSAGKTRYPLYKRLGGPQGRYRRAENFVPIGIRSRTVQPVVSRYTDWATRPTTEMSTRNISWRWSLPMLKADNLTTFICQLSWNLGASTPWNPQGLSRPVMGLLFLCDQRIESVMLKKVFRDLITTSKKCNMHFKACQSCR